MKKLLSILAAFSMITVSATSVISCEPSKTTLPLFDEPLGIGLDIDKTNAVDDSMRDTSTTHGITNYFVLGDSLSDNHGLTTLLSDISGVPGIIKMGDGSIDNYGGSEADVDGTIPETFSNGITAAVWINNNLGFKTLKSSNQFSEKHDGVYGRNYAVGGAMAATTTGLMGAVINNATIDKQAVSLVKQHKISTNDVVLLDIGGNDLFSISDDLDNTQNQYRIMNEGIQNIEKAIFTLLNNGIKKIIYMDAPDVSRVPRYNDLNLCLADESCAPGGQADWKAFQQIQGEGIISSKEEKELKVPDNVIQKHNEYVVKREKIHKLSLEWHTRANYIEDYAESYYADSIHNFSLFDQLDNLYDSFTNGHKDKTKITDTNFNLMSATPSTFGPLATIKSGRAPWTNDLDPKDIDNYFYYDIVHPTRSVHKHVGEEITKLIEGWGK